MPSINQWGRENPDGIDTPDDAEFVSVLNAQEHGYWGTKMDTTDRQQYTVEGVTSGENSRLGGAGVETHGVDTSQMPEGSTSPQEQQKRAARGRHEGSSE